MQPGQMVVCLSQVFITKLETSQARGVANPLLATPKHSFPSKQRMFFSKLTSKNETTFETND